MNLNTHILLLQMKDPYSPWFIMCAGNKHIVDFSFKYMRKGVSLCPDSVPIIVDYDGSSWTLFHSLHSFYKPQVGKSIVQIYGQSESTVLIQLPKSQVDRAQEMHPNKCNINVCVGCRMRSRRIFNLMDYFACCYKSAAA